MNISFHGATGEVTGSCNLIETKKYKILVDCGMFQGGKFNEEKNHKKLPFNPAKLNAVIITHAHLDHIGRLPLLIQGGYQGLIYTTPATVDLAKLILEDAVGVMEENYRRYGTRILYGEVEVAETLQRFKVVDYGEPTTPPNPPFATAIAGSRLGGIKGGKSTKTVANPVFTLHDAGHIFGSAFVEIQADGKKVVFSGDVGNTDVPILKETENLPKDIDVLVCESTYGGRIHEVRTNIHRAEVVEGVITEALGRKGVLMIPSFALERTQELLYVLNDLIDRRKVLPRVPIFLDSPLAIGATEVYRKYPEYYDKEADKLFKADDDLFDFPGLTFCETREESKKINHVPNPKIIIAGAGMMNGGRILHHAKRYLSDRFSTLLFIGYQAEGTLGRQILNGSKQAKIMDKRIPVKCKIKAVGALSAHADQEKLVDWIGSGSTMPKKVYLNHGETDQGKVLAERLRGELRVDVEVVSKGMKVEI